jgi:AraC-like DNA-binding protein
VPTRYHLGPVYELPGAYLRDVVEIVGRMRVPPDKLLAGLPITLEALGEPNTRVPLRVAEALITRAVELAREPALAFHLGMQMRLSSHGYLGFAAMTANTAREALDLAVRFSSTRTSAIGLALYVEGEQASLVFEERASLGQLREFAIIALSVGIWQLGRQLTGLPIDGVAECAFAQPEYLRTMPLGDRLRFDRPVHRLVFPSSVLDLPLVTADAVAKRLVAEQLERELATLTADAGIAGQIRAAITAHADAAPSLEDIARVLHVSPRTLKRKLADHGTTFSAIRDDLRCQRALLLLDNRTLSIGEVAARLGYTELPNFTRAFRKWTGMTPAAYRG